MSCLTIRFYEAFTIYYTSTNPSRGAIFHWDGATGYDLIWDPSPGPLGVFNVHAADGLLVWTETELVGTPTKSGTSIYRAPWPPTDATLDATLVRKTDLVTARHRSLLAAGQIAIWTQSISAALKPIIIINEMRFSRCSTGIPAP